MPTPDDDHAMTADHHVVGDLHEVIDLGALADHRVARGAAVDRRVGADLDIVLDDDPADLRHLQVAVRAHGEAEAVLADAGARMDDDAVAEQRVAEGRAGADRAIPADPDVGPDRPRSAPITRARADLGTGTDTAPGSTVTPSSSRASGWTWAPGATPLRAELRAGPQRVGMQRGRAASRRRGRDRDDEGRRPGRTARGEAGRRPGRRRARVAASASP